MIKLKETNTGSVSLSYDGERRASYLVVDREKISIRRVDYDIDLEHSSLPRGGLALWHSPFWPV